MSTIQEAIKKADAVPPDVAPPVEAPVPASASSRMIAWWLPNLLMFMLLAVALWNYMSEREYRRQMETRLETAVADLQTARDDVQRVERQSRQMEDLMHAELEAANGRIAKMKFDVEQLRAERDLSAAALSSANKRIETLETQSRHLHNVIQTLRRREKSGADVSGSMSWDRRVTTSSLDT